MNLVFRSFVCLNVVLGAFGFAKTQGDLTEELDKINTRGEERQETRSEDQSTSIQTLEGLKVGRASEAEVRSLDHQIEAQKSLNALRPLLRERFKMNDFDINAMAAGMVDSDYGKLVEGLDLLKNQSHQSDELLNVLSGHSTSLDSKTERASKIIEELAGGKLLPNKSPDEIRRAMTKVRGLTGFLHELPGMAESIISFKSGQISEETFRIRIAANLFHNGPAEGYLGETLIPMVETNLKAEGFEGFFEGTVFSKGKSKLTYPSPNNKYSAIHTIFDRLDAGTGGGWLKIQAETAAFVKIGDHINEMLNEQPAGTKRQLAKLETDLIKAMKANPENFEGISANDFSELIKEAKDKVEKFKKATNRSVRIEGDHIVIDGKSYSKDSPQLSQAWKEKVNALLKAEEPMKLHSAIASGKIFRTPCNLFAHPN